MRRMDRGLVEHLDEPAMNLCLLVYGFSCIFEIQYIYYLLRIVDFSIHAKKYYPHSPV